MANYVRFMADGSDGFYVDAQAEALLRTARGHVIHFHKHGSNNCRACGRYARLDFTGPSHDVWTLTGAALEESCEYASIPYTQVTEGDFVSVHSVNGATYGPPVKIDRLTATQVVAGTFRVSRTTGKLIGSNQTSLYASFVRPRSN
jgi:hypothetical protein